MRDRVSRRRRRKNPYAGLIHLLNRRYHDEWQRAELLQNDVTNLTNSKFARDRRVVAHGSVAGSSRIRPWCGNTSPRRPSRIAVRRSHGRKTRVSIIIPFRDRPELLRNCLRGLRRGTHTVTKSFSLTTAAKNREPAFSPDCASVRISGW